MAAARSAAATAASRRAFWFRVDLRLDDNPALHAACEGAESLLPVYVFDPAWYNVETLAGARKSSARRARFLIESVACLRKNLEAKGSGLAVAVGKPQEVIPKLVAASNAGQTWLTQGICSEETRDEVLVEKGLKRGGATLRKAWGNTLYLPEECGCSPQNIPLLFTSFKNKAEGRGKIREPLSPPKLPALPTDKGREPLAEALSFLPTLEQLGYPAEEAKEALTDDPRGVLAFQGGEDAALKRVQSWMFDSDRLKEYFEIRNGMLGEGYSSKLSPWLALGCISPRRIWKEAQRYEKERGIKNKSTYWLIFELEWRDFYVYMAYSQGDKIFKVGGVTGDKTPWKGSRQALEKWKAGRTGDQLIDANMRELAATGFMSNRGRQNVASYLIFDLGVDWRYGAAHFEEHLLDHDPASNWGNWVAAAGLTGQRINKFNTKKQLNDYDPKREYVNHWLQGGSAPKTARLTPRKEETAEAEAAPAAAQGGSRRWGSARSGGKGEKGGKGGGKGYDKADRGYKRTWQGGGHIGESAYGA